MVSDSSSVRTSSDSELLDAIRPYVLGLPGMRPHAPKRNVIVGFVYLYVIVVGVWFLL